MAIRKIVSRSITDGAVASADITNATIATADIADNAVTSAKLTYPLTTFSSTGIDDNADALAMTIDSSENVLVKKTATNYQTVGVEAKSTGQLWATADQNNPIIAVRKTNDGKIQTFYKDTTEAGSIGNAGARLFINSGNVGLNFAGDGSNQILPSNAGANRDDAIILGTTNVRFKDLYLSGGVFLGGTGTANKLDDYEEGTFTPSIDDSSSGLNASYSTRVGQYTKVGNLVHIAISIQLSDRTSTNNQLYITGLPFTSSFVASANRTELNVTGSYINFDSNYTFICARITDNQNQITPLMNGDNVAQENFRGHDISTNTSLFISGSYYTA